MITFGKRISEINNSLLVGAELVQIAFGLHQVNLGFHEEIQVSIEDEFIYTNPEGEDLYIEDGYMNATIICRLLGLSIINSELESNGNLTLSFNDKTKLTLLKLSEPESFNVTIYQDVFVS